MPEDYYGLLPEEAGLLQALLAGEQGLPTMQPVTAVPAGGEQSLPTAQPVQAVPADGIDYVDLSKINLTGLNPLADVGPAYDPNMVFNFDIGAGESGTTDASGKTTWTPYNAPVVFQPGERYTLTDYQNKPLGTAATADEMRALIALADSNKNSGWNLYRGDVQPGAQLFGHSPRDRMLLYAALAAAAVMGGSALLGAGAGGAGAGGAAAAGTTAGTAAGTAAGTTAALGGTAAAAPTLAAAAPAFGGITVVGAPTAGIGAALAPTLAATGTLGAALAAAQPGPVNYSDQVYDQPTQDIVVEGAKPISPVTPTPPLTIDEIMTLPAATTLAPNTSNITEPSTLKPGENSLLKDIMRYYSLGSGVLDALGVGQGGGNAAPTTPYTSTLGALPTFGRGAFTPYQGDYEQYGFGPEFNFFGGAQTNG